jgi:hypothetical protein
MILSKLFYEPIEFLVEPTAQHFYLRYLFIDHFVLRQGRKY